jgi:hypothetical protein
MKPIDSIRVGSRNADSLRIVGNLTIDPGSLPGRKGKRWVTVRGPLHVQCSDNSDDMLLRELVEEVATWPGIEPSPLPVSKGTLVSLRVDEGLASENWSNFIAGNESANKHSAKP